MILDRLPSGGIDGEAEAGGEADGAEEAQGVFGEAGGGVTNGAEDTGFQIGEAADEVDDFATFGVFEESVDRKITALGIFFRGRKSHGFWATAVFVRAIGAEGGDLGVVTLVADDDDAEVGADLVAFRKKFEDLGRGGGGGDVVVLGFEAEDFVAHAAAGEIRDVARLTQLAGEFSGGLAWGHREGRDC